MTTTYTPSATWHPGMTMPADGEKRTAAAQNTPDQAIADNTAYLKAHLPLEYSAVQENSPGSYTATEVFNAVGYSGVFTVDVPNVAIGDTLLLSFTGCYGVSGTSWPEDVYMQLFSGAAGTTGLNHAWHRVHATGTLLPTDAANGVSLQGRFVATVAGTHKCRLRVQPGGDVVTLYHGALRVVRVPVQ